MASRGPGNQLGWKWAALGNVLASSPFEQVVTNGGHSSYHLLVIPEQANWGGSQMLKS